MNMFQNSSFVFPFKNSSLTTDGPLNFSDDDCENSEDSTVEKTVKVLAYISILIVSLIGNALVIAVIYKNKQLHKSINYFVFNMAVSDLFTPLTIMPVKIVEVISGSTAFKIDSPLILGNILCKLCYFFPDVSVLVSIESLLLISMDRFIAVVFPLKTTLITSKVRLVCIVCTWIVAIAVYAPYFYFFRLFPNGNETHQCRLQWGPAFDHEETHERYVTATFIAFIVIPVCILAILYSTIAWTLKQNRNQMRTMSSSRTSHGNKMNRQIIRLSVAIIMTFVACIVPMLVYMFMNLWPLQKLPSTCTFEFVASFMLHSWSALNPCICFISSNNYRIGLKQMLSRKEGGLRMQTETTSARTTSSAVRLRLESLKTI